MTYRQLTDQEIQQLEKQSCICENWADLEVSESIIVERIHRVRFTGKCRIGKMEEDLRDAAGILRPSGIYNAAIHQSDIKDNVYISNVGLLSNYTINPRVLIENVNILAVSDKTSFGNGIEIEVLNEGGGRELIIYDRLTAQIAWLMVICRHDSDLISNLEELIKKYCDEKLSDTGTVESGSSITNSNTLKNIFIGKRVEIRGAGHLENGSILGDEEDLTIIGDGVDARNFIVQSGSQLDQGALIDKCFVGQGARIGKQFSAENSAFFANCEGFHSEAVSLFAGPYTVTHHKSTLLIAGMYSFYNAGSGTNQSNHMYKLGPVHQGIVERGSKTGSFSYLLWPSRVGVFSVVMDKHGGNFDSSNLPFSYLTVEGGKSMLTPAMNLLTVGTRRDSEKWPKRDRRKSADKFDLIHFDLFNPYVMSKVIRGIDVLNELYEKTPKEQETVNYKGLRIKRLMLKSCRKYYEMALYIFLGEQLLQQLDKIDDPESFSDIIQIFRHVEKIDSDWNDLSGMILCGEKLRSIIDKIKRSEYKSIEELRNNFYDYYHEYEKDTWSWAVGIMEERENLNFSQPEKKSIVRLINLWKENSIRLNNMILSDAKKEFDQTSRIGFGLGADPDKDFENVRGEYDENSFVKGLLEENKRIERKADNWITKIHNIK